MTLTDTTSGRALLVRKPHPIRGILWGLMLGLGLTVVLVVTRVIPLELTQMVIVLALATLVGVLWSLFGPAKAPSGPVPVVLVNQPVKQAVTKPLVQHTEPMVVAEPATDDTPPAIEVIDDAGAPE